MNDILKLIMTLTFAFAVGLLFRRMNVPGGMMLGGIVGAALLNVLTGNAYTPYFIRFFAQSVAGGFLGLSLDRDKMKQLPRLAVPLVIIVIFLLATNIVMAWLFVAVSPMDSLTALFAGIAGGINDVPLIAADMGADAGQVAVLQFVRLITGIAVIPLLIRMMDKNAGTGKRSRREKKKKKPVPFGEAVIGIGVAMLGGYVGKLIGLPGGVLLFSMVATACLHIGTGRGAIHADTKLVAQLFAGAFVGSQLHQQDFLNLRYLVVPALILMVMFVGNCLISAFILRKTTDMTIKESMLSCSPAGAGEIALLSSDLNITTDYAADIMILHVFRVMIAVSLFPQLIPFIAKLL